MDEVFDQPAPIDGLQGHFVGPQDRCFGRARFAPFEMKSISQPLSFRGALVDANDRCSLFEE